MLYVCRKVEDLQFTIEEETITKDELEVSYVLECILKNLLL